MQAELHRSREAEIEAELSRRSSEVQIAGRSRGDSGEMLGDCGEIPIPILIPTLPDPNPNPNQAAVRMSAMRLEVERAREPGHGRQVVEAGGVETQRRRPRRRRRRRRNGGGGGGVKRSWTRAAAAQRQQRHGWRSSRARCDGWRGPAARRAGSGFGPGHAPSPPAPRPEVRAADAGLAADAEGVFTRESLCELKRRSPAADLAPR